MMQPWRCNSENCCQEQKKRKSKVTTIHRPIIAICNDLYTPSLRPLRQVAQVYTIDKPNAPSFICR